MNQRELLSIVLREHDAGRKAALCAIVATYGSTPQAPGAMIVVDESANLYGTIGGGCVEAAVRRLAHQRLSEPVGPLATFVLDHDFGQDDGMICGGRMDVAIQPILPTDDVATLRAAAASTSAHQAIIPFRVVGEDCTVEYRVRLEHAPRLVIAGGGHIGRILSEMAVSVGFEVHVVDERGDYANPRRFPPPIATHVGDICKTLGAMNIDEDTFVVIVTRGHKHDESALRAVIHSSARYIGMIGSRRKIDIVYQDLRYEGVTEAQLARVHAPVGLTIGAVTTEEIALSIAAELVKERRSSDGPVVEGPLPLPVASPLVGDERPPPTVASR